MQIKNVSWEILDLLRGRYHKSNIKENIATHLFLLEYSSRKNLDLNEFDEVNGILEHVNRNGNFEEKEVLLQIYSSSLDDVLVSNLIKISQIISNIEPSLVAELLYLDYDLKEWDNTPQSVTKLVVELLELSDGMSVLDMCAGNGTFLNKLSQGNFNLRLFGEEINNINYFVTKVVFYLNNKDVSLSNIDTLSNYSHNLKYDRVFSDFPKGLANSNYQRGLYKQYQKKHLNLKLRKSSTDYAFIEKLLNSLNENGKGIYITSPGLTYNGLDYEYRKEIIEKNYLEGIISLPANLFGNTAIPMVLWIVSKKKKNKYVKMVDARNDFVKFRRKNIISDENIEAILCRYKSNSNIVDIDRIRSTEYNLVPNRYLGNIVFENPKKIEELTEKVFRGKQFNKAKLDAIKADHKSNYRLLRITNIDGVFIRYNELLPIQNINGELDRYVLQKGDIVITAKGNSFKSAIVEEYENHRLIADGNLIVIRPNVEYLNPYYLKMFLDSETGLQMFENLYLGEVIKSLSMSDLKQANIPYNNLDKQGKMVNEYLALRDEILYLENKISKVKSDIRNII